MLVAFSPETIPEYFGGDVFAIYERIYQDSSGENDVLILPVPLGEFATAK